LDDVRQAARTIAPAAHHTPTMTCSAIDEIAGMKFVFKCEQFQRVGAFKFRGAYNAVAKIANDPAKAARGVITHSSGNHGQALALAAKKFGLAATIVMPSTASGIKRAAVQSYGARVVLCQPTLESRESTVAEIQRESGAYLVHPFDDPSIIAGQGTAALELLAERSDWFAIVAPIGGGGLISGTAIVAKELLPQMLVIGAEPATADDAFRSKQAGRFIPANNPQTVADGLRTSLGQWTWPIVRDRVDQIVRVSDAEILSAMRLLWERAKLMVEPSSATVLAAALRPEFPRPPHGMRVGMILSGGNVDLDQLPWTATG
jgi:threonine dehydratase